MEALEQLVSQYHHKNPQEYFNKRDVGFFFCNRHDKSYGSPRKARAKRVLSAFNRLFEDYSTIRQALEDFINVSGYNVTEKTLSPNIPVQAPEFIPRTPYNNPSTSLYSRHLKSNSRMARNKSFMSPRSIQSESMTGNACNICWHRSIRISHILRHRVCYKVNHTMKCTYAPIVLELLIPKIQKRIEKVMRYCPYITDPLEVLAELRLVGYKTDQCISLFKSTKSLRKYLNENMNSQLNVVENYSFWLSQDDALSIRTEISHDDFPVSQDPTNIFSGAFESVIQGHEITPRASSDNDDTLNDSNNELDDDLEQLVHKFDEQINISFPQSSISFQEMSVDQQLLENQQEQATSPLQCIPAVDRSTEMDQLSQMSASTQTIAVEHFSQTTKDLLVCMTKEVKQLKSVHTKVTRSIANSESLHKVNNEKLHKQWLNIQEHLHTRIITDTQRSKMILMAKRVEEMKRKVREEIQKRKSIFNTLQDHLGNIRVYCRVRLMPQCQIHTIRPLGDDKVLLTTMENKQEEYQFQHVFTSETPQDDIFSELRSLVQSFIDGFNVCFMTYGGEASGKTYTLFGKEGAKNSHGLVQNALWTLLNEKELNAKNSVYSIDAHALEIYNDTFADLMGNGQKLNLFVDSGLDYVCSKLTSRSILTKVDVDEFLTDCRGKRRVARTALSPASSRSHFMILIKLTVTKSIYQCERMCSYLAMCDLAGFEDTKKADTYKDKTLSAEAGFINKSLSAFNRLFLSLRTGQDPNTAQYRDSKLTHFLKPFLINSGKCALIVNARSDLDSRATAQNTLRFGEDVQKVALGKAKKQIMSTLEEK